MTVLTEGRLHNTDIVTNIAVQILIGDDTLLQNKTVVRTISAVSGRFGWGNKPLRALFHL